mgnify:CR=1 FL=1
MSSTRVVRHVNAPRAKVYGAFLDADAVQKWMVPPGMTSRVHAFEGQLEEHSPGLIGDGDGAGQARSPAAVHMPDDSLSRK